MSFQIVGDRAIGKCVECGADINVSCHASGLWKLHCSDHRDAVRERINAEYATALKNQGSMDEFVSALREHGGKIVVFHKNRNGLFGAMAFCQHARPGDVGYVEVPWYARFANVLNAFVEGAEHKHIKASRISVPSRSHFESAVPWGEVGHSKLELEIVQ